jgi:hypothetical protein
MITQELVDYIKAQRSGGTTDAEIRGNLMLGGEWSRSDIDEAFLTLENPALLVPPQSPRKYTPYIIGVIILIIIIVLFIFIK